MGTIKLRRGSGSPAGSLAQYEVAMDVAARNLYTSSDGIDAVIIGQDVEYFLTNNTISGISNVATNYGEIASFQSLNYSAAGNTTGIELSRNLSTDGAVSGRDPRGVAQTYAVYSDSGNSNGSATAIYPGGLSGQSGSNDGASPHWLEAWTYDDGISSFTKHTLWDGTKDEFNIYPSTTINANSAIDGTAGSVDWVANSLGDSVLNIKTNNSGWWASQLSFEDSNDKTFSLIGIKAGSSYRTSWLFDPNNNEGRTGVTSYPGDYSVVYAKDFTDPAAIQITQQVFGANDGYIVKVYDDNNSGSPNPGPFGSGGYAGYGYKPMVLHVEEFEVQAKDSDTSVDSVFVANDTAIDCKRPVQFPSYTTTERNALTAVNGMQVYNSTDSKMQAYAGGAWVDLH